MSRIWAIATNTFREAVRDKVLNSILFFAALLLLVSIAMRDVAIGDTEKVVRGVALGGIAGIGAIISIFLGVGLVWKEIERKTVYTLASKPLPRWMLLLGKYLGLWITLAVEVGVLAFFYVVIVGSQQGMPPAGFYLAIALLMLELTLLTAWSTLFSTFASPMTASAYSLCIYVIGHFADDLRRFGESAEDPGFRQLATILYRVLPNLELFNVRAEAVHNVVIPGSEIAWATVYCLGYTTAVLAVASVVFERRDFK